MIYNRVIADFRVSSASEARNMLAAAVTDAEREAFADKTAGVLVTRHDFDRFSVALSSVVPFGVTVEHDFAGRRNLGSNTGLPPAS